MEKITKEEIKKLMEIKGETRGFNIKCDGEYILKTKGKKGLEKLEKKLEELGCPIKYLKLKNMEFYPVGLRAISFLALKETFGFSDKEINEIGGSHARIPLAIKLFLKYFYSIPEIIKRVQEMWRKYYTVGELTFPEFNEKEKYAILQLRGLNLHPVWCLVTAGYFASIAGLVLGKKKVECQEIKCPFRGDKFHEFLIKWK